MNKKYLKSIVLHIQDMDLHGVLFEKIKRNIIEETFHYYYFDTLIMSSRGNKRNIIIVLLEISC